MDNLKKTELNHLQTDLADNLSHYTQFKALLVLALVVTLISYLFFSGHLKLGNPLYWGEYFNKGATTTVAFYFMLFSVILLGVFLAWVKHFAYSHFTTYRAIAGVMVTLVGFALLAEMFAALEDQKAKADIQLEGNAAYRATIQPAVNGMGVSPTLAGEIAAASQKLARCQANLGKPGYRHCEGDKAKVTALEKQQAAALTAQVAGNAESEKLRYQRQDQMKADAHNDFIVGIAKFYAALFGDGTDKAYIGFISWANITLMLIIAVAFERLHAFLIEAGRDIKGNIRGIEQRIAQLQDNTNPLAGGNHLPPVGAPLFNYQRGDNHPAPFGTVPAMAKKDGGYNGTTIGFHTDGRPFYGFEDPKKQAALDALNLATGSEDRKTHGNRSGNMDKTISTQQAPNHPTLTPHAHVGGKHGEPHAAPDPHAPHAHVGGIQPGTDEALQAATDAPVGSRVGCPHCGGVFTKRNQQHRFCSPKHRDAWHNGRDPKKQQFLKNRNMRG